MNTLLIFYICHGFSLKTQSDAEESVDDVKAAWATGKSMQTLAKEKWISEETLKAKMATERKTQLQAQLQILVSKGVITQAQADARATFMDSFPKGKMGRGGGHRGFGF